MPEVPLHTESNEVEDDGPFWTTARRHRLAWALVGLLVVILLAVVPPLISINRYQKHVATSISGSLGRPVHFDNLSLHLLPLPGITIENFVVGESPDFGAEPVMRANTVEARIRIGSLWRRRIEVSRIALESPSINLVRRRSDGAWNLQSILMQASRLESAPTAQTKAGPAPRFPYIEATDARINIKSDNDKLPFTFKETELALWLPEPDEWHLRLTGKPVRTDTDVSDVGLIRVEATLGRATGLAEAPIDLTATWKPTPLGEAGKLTVGYDLGWRGEASAAAALKGTLGQAKLTADLHLLALRRADFVPANTAEINAHCEATTGGLLRSLTDLRCAIPTSPDTSMFAAIDFLRKAPPLSEEKAPTATASGPQEPGANATTAPKVEAASKPGVVLIRGQIPDLMNWRASSLDITLHDASPNYALAWLRLFSKRIPADLSIGGKLSLTASRAPLNLKEPTWDLALICQCELPKKTVPATDQKPSTGAAKDASSDTATRWLIRLTHTALEGQPADAALALTASPQPPSSDNSEPVIPVMPVAETVTGQLSRSGYTLIYGSRSLATLAASLLPPLGDGVQPASDATGPIESERGWNATQTWTSASTTTQRKPAPPRRKR